MLTERRGNHCAVLKLSVLLIKKKKVITIKIDGCTSAKTIGKIISKILIK